METVLLGGNVEANTVNGVKTYGVKPDELLAWHRLLPNQKQTFALVCETTEFPFKEMLVMATWRMFN